jgi:acid phosphatase
MAASAAVNSSRRSTAEPCQGWRFTSRKATSTSTPANTDVLDGDRHIADVIGHLQKSPQWAHMVVIVTYDENGGFWDHAAPPKGDRWGPGLRVPALIVSPFAKKGFVDHTLYDTTSILSLITNRFALPMLPGLQRRNTAVGANGHPPLGDLTNALDFATR